MVAYSFDSGHFPPAYSGSSQLPAGKHPVRIVAAVPKPNKDNTGGYIELTLEAIDGPAKGGKQTDRLNVYHQNPLTVEIANKQLSAYCHVTGVYRFNDTDELTRGQPFIAEIGPQKSDPQYNEVKSLFDINGNEPGKAGAGSAPNGGAGAGGPPAGFGASGNIPQGGGQPQGGAPAGAGWGAPPAGGQPQGGGQAWGGGQPQGDPNAGQQGQGGAPGGWGQGAPAGGQPQGGAPAGGGWGQGAPAGGGAPWGQR
ncbi:single-stranded DNA-binding protein [Sphingomonas phage Kimi]|nr:single-stranded DNA-binding protein [Sphingomonas phage Kimi]